MRLDTLLLADAAVASPDGKISILGAGITRFSPPMLPFVVPQLALVVRLRPDDEAELARLHLFSIRLTDPNGVDVVPAADIPLPPTAPRLPLLEGEERFIQVTGSLFGIQLTMPGPHRVVVTVDGVEVATLTAVVAPPGPPISSVPPNRAARRHPGGPPTPRPPRHTR